jgi:hypothetical protein
MNISYMEYLVEQQRRQDEIKAAEMYRLAKQAKDNLSASPAPNASRRLFSVLGMKMVQWGKRLQNLYPAWRKDTISENPC